MARIMGNGSAAAQALKSADEWLKEHPGGTVDFIQGGGKISVQVFEKET